MRHAIILLLFLGTFAEISAQETCPPDTLEKVTIYGGKKRHKKLLGKGQRVPGGRTVWTPDKVGAEIGSIIKVEHPFEVEEIIFGTLGNSIDSLKLEIEIRSTDNLYHSLLDHPLSVKIPKGRKQKFHITPDKQLIIEPGEYFIAVLFSDCAATTKARWQSNTDYNRQEKYKMSKESIQFPLYLKKSYVRENKEAEIESIPVNLGLKIRGVEYR